MSSFGFFSLSTFIPTWLSSAAMPEKYHTLDIEKCLGFKFPRGIPRSLGAIKDVSVMDALYKSILKLIEEFGNLDFRCIAAL